jgi:hypothetical protein
MAGGQVGTCDSGTSTCNYNCPSNMKSCTAGGTTSCIPSSGCCTSGDCTGTCMACSASTHTCVAATNEADPNGRCAGTCDASGACKSKLGQTCNTVAGGCVSGSTCSPDGYCCNTACTGSCVACDLPGLQGTCTNLASASAPHSNHAACSGGGTTCAGSCNGSGACSYPTVSCGSASCSGSSSVGTGTCSAGTCVVPAAQLCGGHLVCGQNACKSTCTADADCLSGYFCESASCHLAAVAVGAGEWHACALLTDGSIRCWGRGDDGELGNGMDEDTGFEGSATPVPVMGLPGPASAIAVASDSTCAVIKSDGSVWCWGSGASGQFGNGSIPTNTFVDSSTPVKSNLVGASAISMEFDNQVCAIVSGSVYCWGAGVLTPTKVAGVSGVTALASGDYHTCAGGGTSVWCWGDNSAGELGNGSLVTSATPQAVQLAALKGASILGLAAGSDLSCGLFNSNGAGGGVYCWGAITATSTPQAVPGFSGATIINGGENEVCAINGSGTLLCWGDRNDIPSSDPQPTNPGVVAGAPTPVISVASAISAPFACAVSMDGAVWCWGPENVAGVLGSNTLPSSTTPVQIPGW